MSATATAEGCDGAFWKIITTETKEEVRSEVATTIYRFDKSKIKPSEDHGFYKYDVLMIQDETKKAEVFSAYIGDVDFFINNQAKSGRVGLLVKKGAIPKRTVKKMFNLILNNMEFSKKSIKSILTEVH
jgi:hypothetical protein